MVKTYDLVKAVAQYNKVAVPHSLEDSLGLSFGSTPSEINAAIVGPKGIILTDNEAVHTVHSLEDSLELTFGSIPLKDLIGSTPLEEVELGTWVRTFGSRIEANYCKLLASIKEIGLDNSEFPRKVRL
jgi:hypothetical protein